jgi:hypothetical protein
MISPPAPPLLPPATTTTATATTTPPPPPRHHHHHHHYHHQASAAPLATTTRPTPPPARRNREREMREEGDEREGERTWEASRAQIRRGRHAGGRHAVEIHHPAAALATALSTRPPRSRHRVRSPDPPLQCHAPAPTITTTPLSPPMLTNASGGDWRGKGRGSKGHTEKGRRDG